MPSRLQRRSDRTPSAPGAPSPTRPATAPPPVQIDVFHTLPGRLFILTSILLVLAWLVQRVTTLPLVLDVFHKVVSLAWIAATVSLVALAIARNRRTFFWRVRRKLILSYVLLGLVPVALVVMFAMAGGRVLYMNVANYLFHEGIENTVAEVQQIASTGANEISQNPKNAAEVLDRRTRLLSALYPGLSLALVPTSASGTPLATGAWRHMDAPTRVPAWVLPRGFAGLVALHADGGDAAEDQLLIRAAQPVAGANAVVIVDLPLNTDLIARLHDDTGTQVESVTFPSAPPRAPSEAETPPGKLSFFRYSVGLIDAVDWATGATERAAVRLEAPLGQLYHRIADVQSAQVSPSAVLLVLILLGGLFVIIQGVALVFGGVLARSITHAIHELFVGTERVRQGDFAHRIGIQSHDQLGDLADSFNRMSASIEHLLHVQREKQRLDDELRIARDIQKSLLPAHVPQMAGLSVADLCEPAREVGGDYYDFFELGPRQLGVLIADVAGKGTSAALYMAELKGLMLSLSRTHRSPRRLMIEMNDLLAGHLDNRSFITMTYVVIDLDAGTLTCARAGHTPLLVVRDGASESIMPDGMVLGLSLPGASERFQTMLEEHTRPLQAGDVVVLYTDGITESMNAESDLFGENALARVVVTHHDLDAPGIRERIRRAVKDFVGEAEPHDDMTMIVLKVMEPAAS